MSLSPLQECLARQDFAACARLAEEMLAQGHSHRPAALAEIHYALCRSKLHTNDYLGAISAGNKALAAGHQAGDRDLLGHILFCLGTSYLRSRHYYKAVQTLNQFFAHRDGYTKASDLEGEAWLHLGQAQAKMNQVENAVQALEAAHRRFDDLGDLRRREQARHELAALFIETGQLDKVARLLETGEQYVRENPMDAEARLDYLLDHARFCHALSEFALSSTLALKALQMVGDAREDQFRCYMVLYQNTVARREYRDALGFALSARMAALDAHRFDLEFEAAEAMFELIRRQGPELVEQLEDHYSDHGLDIYQYIPDSLLRRYSAD